MNIKLKAQIILIAVVGLTSLLSAYTSFSASQSLIDNAKQEDLEGTATLIQNNLRESAAKAAARASFIASIPSIQRALRARDRKDLAKRLVPALLEQRAEFGVREAQFHLAPAISFLRMYSLHVGHGEDLSSFREMVLATNRHREAQRGIEIGRRGLSIRGVQPVVDAEGPIGSFEIGMDFAPVLKNTQASTGFDAGVYIKHKLMDTVATQLPKPAPEDIVGEFQAVEGTNWPVMRPLVNGDLLGMAHDVSTRLQQVGGVDFGTVVVPVLDYKGANIGAIVAVRNFSEFQSRSRWALLSVVATTLFQMLLLCGGVFVVLNRLIFKPMAQFDAAVHKLSLGQAAPELAGLAQARNEMGELAKALDGLQGQAIPAPSDSGPTP